MAISWRGYESYPGVALFPNELSRADARSLYELCMATKDERIAMLGRLAESDGVVLGHDDDALQALNDWFSATVEPDPDRPGRLLAEWYSVCHDIGLFLGEAMIARSPNLRWEFFTWGAKNIAYQWHVIMGFGTEPAKFHTR